MASNQTCTLSMKIAIVAHHDIQNSWDKNFLELLRVLSDTADRCIVVTTAKSMDLLPESLRHITLIKRPNVGYDFYSYRVGIYMALSYDNVEGVLYS